MQYPDVLPDLYKGSQLVLDRALRGTGKAKAKLLGMLNGQKLRIPFEAVFPGTPQENAFVARIWAQRGSTCLLAQDRLHGASTESKPEVIALSMQLPDRDAVHVARRGAAPTSGWSRGHSGARVRRAIRSCCPGTRRRIRAVVTMHPSFRRGANDAQWDDERGVWSAPASWCRPDALTARIRSPSRSTTRDGTAPRVRRSAHRRRYARARDRRVGECGAGGRGATAARGRGVSGSEKFVADARCAADTSRGCSEAGASTCGA